MSKTKKTGSSSRAQAEPKNSLPDKRNVRLYHLNKWLALLGWLQAVAILFLASYDQTFKVSLAHVDVVGAANLPLFNLSLVQILALSLAISAAFRAISAYYIRDIYQRSLLAGESPYRWLESAFSASLLTVAIGLSAGMRDIASITMLFTLSFAACILAWQYEHHHAVRQSLDARRSLLLLVTVNAAVWLSTGAYVLSAALAGATSSYVVAAYLAAMLAALCSSWLLLQRGRSQGLWRNGLDAEPLFIVLSFGVQSLVAWLLLFGGPRL